MDTTRSVHFPQRLPETNALITLLIEGGSEGTVITFDQIRERTGLDCTTPRGGSLLRSARNIVEKNTGIVWINVRGQKSVQRLGNVEKLDSSSSFLDGARRKARRCRVRLSSIESKLLDNNQRMTLNIRMNLAAVTEAQLSPRTIRAISTDSGVRKAIEASIASVLESK